MFEITIVVYSAEDEVISNLVVTVIKNAPVRCSSYHPLLHTMLKQMYRKKLD